MHLDEFLTAAVILLAVCALSVALFRRLKMGSILGFLAAGFILGPSVLGITDKIEELRHFSEIGVVFLLFIIGLEMAPRRLWSMRRLMFGLGLLQVLLSGAALTGVGLVIGIEWRAAVIIGFGVALSSTAFVLQMLSERGDMSAPHGRAAVSILLLQDMAVVPLLALVPILADEPVAREQASMLEESLLIGGLLVAVFLVGRYVIPFALKKVAEHRNMEAFGMIALLAALGAALAMELVGASMALGAFLMGMLLSASPYRHQIEASVEGYKGLLIGLFFVSVGMSVDVDVVRREGLGLIDDVVILIVLKALILFALALAFRLSRADSVRVAFLLPQCGEFGFVLFGAALATGLMDQESFALAILVVVTTMVLTPFLVAIGDRLAARLETPDTSGAAQLPQADGQVIVCGYGRFGRIVCMMLQRAGVPFTAYDRDVGRVKLGERDGLPVRFGDLATPELVEGAGLAKAAAVVITLNDMHATERLASALRNFFPEIPVFARAHSVEAFGALLGAGVTHAVPEAAEAGLSLGGEVLRRLGVSDPELQEMADEIRRENYRVLTIASK